MPTALSAQFAICAGTQGPSGSTLQRSFQVLGVDAEGKVVVARKHRRKEVLAFFGKLAPCLAGMAVRGGAHYWARAIAKLGHTAKLMPPKYVKAYVGPGKTDAGDAAAKASVAFFLDTSAYLMLVERTGRTMHEPDIKRASKLTARSSNRCTPQLSSQPCRFA
jgi:transposase